MRVAHWWRAVSHARDRGLAPAVRRGPAQRWAAVRVRGAVRRALGAPRSGARPASDEPLADADSSVLWGRDTERRMPGLAGTAGRADPAGLLRQLSPASRLAQAAGQYRRGGTRPDGSVGGARTTEAASQDQALRLSYRVQLRRLGAALLRLPGRRQDAPQPRVDSESIRDLLTHLAVQRRVLASTKNQASCAILFLCREVLRVEVKDLSHTVRDRRWTRLPVVLHMSETTMIHTHVVKEPRYPPRSPLDLLKADGRA